MNTLFSVNLNKLALIRNSRGTNYPNLLYFIKKLLDLGVKGFTVHPRPDERHIRYQDVYDISEFLKDYPDVEFNIEGNPNDKFLALITAVKPHQCTLVPDSVEQLTSDHGYDIVNNQAGLSKISNELKEMGIRCSVFVDPDVKQIQAAIESDIEAIEIYTEFWARSYAASQVGNDDVLQHARTIFAAAIERGNSGGLRVNAGHDLNLENLADFLALGDVEEVSIGHAFTVESIEQGMHTVVEKYLEICHA